MCADSRPSSRDALRRPRRVRPWSDPTQFLRSALICVAAGSAVVTLVGGLAAQRRRRSASRSPTSRARRGSTPYGLRRREDEQVPARDHRLRRRVARLRQRRLARHLPRQRHDARRLSRSGSEPTNHLYRNKRDGTFTDVTAKAGLARERLGPGRLRRRLRQRRLRRSLRHLLGPESSVSQQRRRHVRGRHRARPGCQQARTALEHRLRLPRLRPRRPPRSVRRQLHRPRSGDDADCPKSGLCRYKGILVACGPPGSTAARTCSITIAATARSRTSPRAPASPGAQGTYGLGVGTLDFDNDGWLDIYVANDSNPSALYRNKHDGTFTDIGVDGGLCLQPGRQAAGRHGRRHRRLRSQRHDGHRSRPTSPATRRRSTRTPATASARTAPSPAGIGLNTRWLGWGVGFLDLDNDGWLDLFLVNGHVYPEVSELKTEAGYKQRKVVYRNLRNGRFADVTDAARPAGDRCRRPAAAPPSATSTTTATSTSSSTTSTTCRICSARPAPAGHMDRRSSWWARQSNRNAIGARVRVIDGRRRAVAGGPRRRQLLLAERFARPLRPRRRDAIERARGAVAEWLRASRSAGLAVDRLHTLKRERSRSDARRRGARGWRGAPRRQVDARRSAAEARKLIAEGRAKDAIARLQPDRRRVSREIGRLLGVAYYHADDHRRRCRAPPRVDEARLDGSDRAPRGGAGPRPLATISPTASRTRSRCSRRPGCGRRTTSSSVTSSACRTSTPASRTRRGPPWPGPLACRRDSAGAHVDRGAAHDASRDGADGRSRAQGGTRDRSACRHAPITSSVRWRCSVAGSTRRCTLDAAGARDEPVRRDGARTRSAMRMCVGKWLDDATSGRCRSRCGCNPTDSGPYITLLGARYSEEESARHRRSHAAARHSLRPEQPLRALRPGADAAAGRPHPTKRSSEFAIAERLPSPPGR